MHILHAFLGCPKRRWLAFALLSSILLISGLIACSRTTSTAELGVLAGRSPVSSSHVSRASTLTDGIATRDGDAWNTHRTAVFEGIGAHVIFDLGESRPLGAAWLHGDNNDSYEISTSDDGNSFTLLWNATPVDAGGMRARSVRDLKASGRYVKISASGGDGSYALSEVLLWSEPSPTFPPKLLRKVGSPPEDGVRSNMILFALALLVFAAAARGKVSLWWLAIGALPALVGWQLVSSVLDSWPVPPRGVALARGLVAGVAAVIVLWEAFAPKRFMPDRRVVIATLGMCGVLAVLAFYNLGQPQFWNNKRQNWGFVHHLDLRQYHGTAKFFPEIGFWRLYEADVAAYSEDTGLSLESIARQPMRDLRTNHEGTIGDRVYAIGQVKQRFSPARWQEYKKDTRFFRDIMGTPQWLDTMLDLGGNATPVWMSIAYLLFNAFDTSYRSFLLFGLIDPLLFLILFAALGRTFGLRTMFVCMVVFGANDFVMYGSNWAGAMLRHDWLVYIGLGMCALKRERWLLAGVLLGLATSIRAFPAFAIVGLCIPAVWWIFEQLRSTRRMPRISEIVSANRGAFITGLYSVVTVAVLVVLSSFVLGFGSWKEWAVKVNLLDVDAHVNPISLRTVIIGSEQSRFTLLLSRLPLVIVAVAAFIGMILVSARGKRLEQAAAFGLILLPVLMTPANYYLHLVCFLPLVVIARKERLFSRLKPEDPHARPLDGIDTWVWFSLLGMCAVQYFTTLVTDLRLHFYLSSTVLVGTLLSLLVPIVWRDGGFLLALPPFTSSKPAHQQDRMTPAGSNDTRAGSNASDARARQERPETSA